MNDLLNDKEKDIKKWIILTKKKNITFFLTINQSKWIIHIEIADLVVDEFK